MTKSVLALALCRVSSAEQLENNSLSRQRAAVLDAAQKLNAVIPADGWWSGNVSSKHGTNLKRRDIQEVVVRCKKDKRIKYVIVDEPDRFMRSISEAYYFEVALKELGVTVWFASDTGLNKEDLTAKLLKFTKYFAAEGSNEERQRKSIAGQVKAINDGRYPFSPKPGYKRGYEPGIQEVHPARGPILKSILVKIARRHITPSQGLKELNNSAFMDGHSVYKMDKFRKIVTDPFYAGIVEIDKQVKARNENGLHEPLVTKEQHYALVKIMDNKAKNQAGPRKNGNPKYPISNLLSCDLCTDETNNRYVGFDHSNGKNPSLVYEKYRCRACGHYSTREDVHSQVTRCFKEQTITAEGWKRLIKALGIVWKQESAQLIQDSTRLAHKIKTLKDAITDQVEAATDPTNVAIKDDIMAAITKKKATIAELEDELEKITTQADGNEQRFLKFAFGFVEDMGSRFLEIPPENRLMCKQIVFPAGFRLDARGKVYTPETSPLITLAANKKDLPITEKSLLVRVRGL